MNSFKTCFSPDVCLGMESWKWIHSSSIFTFVRNLHTVLHSGYIRLLLHNSVGGFPFLHMLSNIYCLWIFWWQPFWLEWECLIEALICISLIISDVEHLFVCLLAICISSLEKCLFISFAHFGIGLFVDIEPRKLFVNFGDECFVGRIICKSFLLLCVFSFCLWFPFLSKNFWI